MTNELFPTISGSDLATATGAGGKAYRFAADIKADPQTCFNLADRVGKSYGMRLDGTGTDRHFTSVNDQFVPPGEHGGNAYTSQGGNCHIYVP